MSPAHILSSPFTCYGTAPLTHYLIPEAETYNLLGTNNKDPKSTKIHSENPVTHWRQRLTLSVMEDQVFFPSKQVPMEIMKYIR